MQIDTKLTWTDDHRQSVGGFAERGREAEAGGYHGLWSAESAHDPFLPLVAAAQATSTLQLGTAITVAFARNPMSLAYTAYDLQTLTEGRFVLGLGSQVRPHIERRFSMPWSRPAARMREFIEALRAIWAAWASGERLDFRGDFYTHTLMTPFFSPRPSPFGPPPVYLAAVGQHMTEVAGAVCDGLMPHPFTTARYLRERTLPAVKRGLAESGRDPVKFSISLSGLVAAGETEEEMATAIRSAKERIAFYGSTPTYHPVLELHGWGDLGRELNALSRSDASDRWTRMGSLIGDDVLAEFAIVAEPDRVGAAIAERYGDIVDRFNFYAPYDHRPDLWKPAIDYLSRQ
ncbi:TIGR03617 family F420-dependent LLM class oxidoreductase [Mycobacterium sp. UM_CSW]|uniref:TIGR03617 family F420-dependent LLM class oxidoreductase n=1 Tax=Mycobacterium sp. UM_CSW TaxID=1370119 RepID=UPI000414737E|nr:TIGR03617 family F420-dependent LLM class oxidoreductase [Mycobacterium sp. UM_CSW]